MEIKDIKYGLFQNTCFKKQQHGSCKKSLLINLYKKSFPSIKLEQEHTSKQAVPITYTLGEKFFVAASFESLWDDSFYTVMRRFFPGSKKMQLIYFI